MSWTGQYQTSSGGHSSSERFSLPCPSASQAIGPRASCRDIYIYLMRREAQRSGLSNDLMIPWAIQRDTAATPAGNDSVASLSAKRPRPCCLVYVLRSRAFYMILDHNHEMLVR